VGSGVLLFVILASACPGAGQQPTDARQRVVVAAPARDKILAEMRDMLGALHGVLRALSVGDPAAAEQAARSAGMGVAVDVRPEVRAQLPPSFLQLGMQTHRAFDALADQLRAGASREEALKSIVALTGNCVACHATYRLDESR
jgi:cytochrome c556